MHCHTQVEELFLAPLICRDTKTLASSVLYYDPMMARTMAQCVECLPSEAKASEMTC